MQSEVFCQTFVFLSGRYMSAMRENARAMRISRYTSHAIFVFSAIPMRFLFPNRGIQ